MRKDGPIEIFFSYAHEDEDLMNDIRRQLVVYERNGRILKWHDRMIPPGAEWRDQIDKRLERAKIILLFLSPHFIESHYCYEVEGRVALNRHQAGLVNVVPVILRPCSWEESPFKELQALPQDGRPVSRWKDRDEACLVVARGVMALVDQVDSGTALRAASSQSSTAVLGCSQPDLAPSGSKIFFCARCGQAAGRQGTCSGGYTHHEFVTGSTDDHCSRCGIAPGAPSVCTGGYSHHAFVRCTAVSAFCCRCGAPVGVQSICTGGYIHHAFR